jgi:DDE superfamily endonuclease
MFYNGWQHGHYLSNLFIFTPEGRIVFCVLNAMGTYHDSTLAHISGLYDLLHDIHERTGGICVCDSAFVAKDNPAVLRTAKKRQNNMSAREKLRWKQATQFRQTAEWGMRAMKSAFPRIKEKIMYETKGRRKLMLNLMVLLYNYRSEHVGLNEIKTTFVDALRNRYGED